MCGQMSLTVCKRFHVAARSWGRAGHVAVLRPLACGSGSFVFETFRLPDFWRALGPLILMSRVAGGFRQRARDPRVRFGVLEGIACGHKTTTTRAL